MLANAAFMAWSEGYRGFQLGFSPRSAARVKWLRHNPNLVRTVLAPLFVMGYFNAPPRRLVAVWALTAAIVVAIVVIHALDQPLRAALDIGVVLGLTWGLASFLISLKRTFAAPATRHRRKWRRPKPLRTAKRERSPSPRPRLPRARPPSAPRRVRRSRTARR